MAPGDRDRPLVPQRICGCLPFSYGDDTVHSAVSQGGGLDGVSGSPGRLPPGSGASIFSPVPGVLREGVGFPVSLPLLWPVDGSLDIHPVSSIMHRHGFRVLRYLDDWLVLASTFQEIVRARDFLLWPCHQLGIHVNLPKSSLDPSQTRYYLGMTIQTSPLKVFPTLKRVQKLLLLLQDLLSNRVQSVSVWRQLLGVMSSMSALIPGARLRMRSLQLRLNVSGPLLSEEAQVSWDDCWWSDVSHLQAGLPLGEDRPDLYLFTNALDTGWGASLGDTHLSGSWSHLYSRFSINHRELLAVLFAVRGFLPSLRGRVVAVFSDNTTALACLKKQGGTGSSTLNAVAQTVLHLCESSYIQLLPQFIPGRLNVLADSLSRRTQIIGSEWTLCSEAFCQLLCRWPATIDLFATAFNYCLPVYFSSMVDPQSVGMDAMLQSWDGLQAYAFPPFGLLSRVLAKVRQSRGMELTLVAPFWPRHPWFPDLLELLVEIPFFLPRRRDLLKQPHFHHYHQNLLVLQLTAGRISSDPQDIPDSLRRWLGSLPSAVESPRD